MKQNFHFEGRNAQPNTKKSQLVQQLFQIDAQLQEKRKRLLNSQKQKQDLQRQFYEQPSTKQIPTRNKLQPSNPISQDFFSKFERNPNTEQLKKQEWKRSLQEQIDEKRQAKLNENKKKQMADDIMNEILGENRRELRFPQRPESGRVGNQREQEREVVTRETATRETERQGKKQQQVVQKEEMVNMFVKEDDEEVARRKEEQRKLHRQELEKQIQFERKKKQMQKKEVNSWGMLYDPTIPVKPPKKALQFTEQPAQPNPSPSTILNEREQSIKGVKNRYKKGLMSLDEMQETIKKIEMMYPLPPKQPKEQIRQSKVPTERVRFEDQKSKIKQKQEQMKSNPSQVSGGKSEYMVSRVVDSNLSSQPTQINTNRQAPQMPAMPDMQMPYQMMNMTAMQMEFMKKMFDEMKELLKTNMMVEQQRMQETMMRNMTMQGMPGMATMQQMMPGMMQMAGMPGFPPGMMPGNGYMGPQFKPMQTPTNNPTKINKSNHQQQGYSNPSSGTSDFYQQSLQTDVLKIPYQSPILKPIPSAALQHKGYSSLSQSKAVPPQQQFFLKPTKIRPFKSFSYVEAPGNNTREMPSVCVYMSHPQAKRELKRRFDQDLVYYQKLKVEKEVEVIKARHSRKEDGGKEKPVLEEGQKAKKNFKAEEPMPVPITPVYQADINPFRKLKENREKEKQKDILPLESDTNSSGKKKVTNNSSSQVDRMMAECLEAQTPQDDLAEVRRRLFQNNPFSIASRHNQILQKYEYSQSSQQDIPIPKPTTIINDSRRSRSISQQQKQPKNSPKKSSVVGQSKPSRMSSRFAESVQDQTIESVQYESLRKNASKECLQLSRKQLQIMKKLKENVLIDFVVMDSKKNQQQLEEEVEEQIEVRRNQEEDPNEESATLVSGYEESIVKSKRKSLGKSVEKSVDRQVVGYANVPLPKRFSPARSPRNQTPDDKAPCDKSIESKQSNITSLRQARRKAKQSRPKQKKDGVISIEAIQRLQRDLKKKDNTSMLTPPPILQPSITKISAKPANPKNSKDLLHMLDNMVEDEDQDQYALDFESYRSGSRADSQKQRF